MRANTGIFASEEEALNGLVARLVSALNPQSIWLFGSRARGTHRPDSDFDLFVVGKKEDDWVEDYQAVYRPTMGTGVACDVVPCDEELFEVGQQLCTTLVARVISEGREVFHS